MQRHFCLGVVVVWLGLNGCSPSGADTAADGASGRKDDPEPRDAGGPTDGDSGIEMPDSDASVSTPLPFTFFAWSDLHVTDGETFHLDAPAGAERAVGTPYPSDLGGAVEEPKFILDCGDSVEWPTAASVREYARLVDEVSPFAVFPVLGNHDLLNTSGSPTFENFFLERYTDTDRTLSVTDTEGATVAERSYSFARHGVAFIGLSHSYSKDGESSQPVPPGDLEWLRKELDRYGAEMPIVIWLHLGVTALSDLESFTALLKRYNVILVLGGHYHFAFNQRVDGIDFAQSGSRNPGAIHRSSSSASTGRP